MRKGGAIVGVSDHAGWAVLMTVARDGALLDRRRVELVDQDLPCLPHHHEALALPLAEGVALVERVRASADRHARVALEALAAGVPSRITAIALRACPPLPPTIAERLASYRAQNVADTVMFREALAGAATARGWAVRWYDPRRVFAEAGDGIQARLSELGKALGSPWQKDHRQAMAAAIAAARER